VSRVGPREPEAMGLAPRLSLSDLLWVANTRHGPAGHWFARVGQDHSDHDHLSSDAPAVEYLANHHVPLPAEPPGPRDLKRLAAVRDMVRGLVEPRAGWTPAARAILDATRFRVDTSGHIRAEGSGWDAFIGDLMPQLIEIVERRDALRMCGNPDCRLMFLDMSKNRARLWCDNGGCGNRARVRRYRSRVTSTERPPLP
jgi:CGNR zinc finger